MAVDWTKPLRRKGDKKPVVERHRFQLPEHPWYVQFDNGDIRRYSEAGQCYSSPSDNDLENVPEKRTLWLNVMEHFVTDHDTREDADADERYVKRIARLKIEYEVGQMDE